MQKKLFASYKPYELGLFLLGAFYKKITIIVKTTTKATIIILIIIIIVIIQHIGCKLDYKSSIKTSKYYKCHKHENCSCYAKFERNRKKPGLKIYI